MHWNQHSLDDNAYWHNFVDSAQVFSGFATAIAAIFAVISVFFIALQIYLSGKLARSNLAIETHRDYLKLCIEYPQLSSSEAMKLFIVCENFDDFIDEEVKIDINKEKCLWFLSYLLNSVEQIVDSTSFLWFNDELWAECMADQLKYHRELLNVVWPKWKWHYGQRLRTLVELRVL